MSSRTTPARSCALPLVVLLALTMADCRRAERPKNLLLVCIDTLRADHVGSYGYGRNTTPALDQLASRGSRFTRAFATSSWTVPSVASVLTSRLPSDHGAGVAGDVKHLGDGNPPTPIRASVGTLTDLLRARGYRTALFSANPFLYGEFGRSFDTTVVARLSAERLVDRALDWLGDGSERFFLYLQFMDVHQPNAPPEPYFSLFPTPGAGPRSLRHADWSYGQLTDPLQPAFESFRSHRVALYDGSIRYVDAQVERLLAALGDAGALESTLVIVYSDHGEEFWDHAVAQSDWADDPRGIWGIGHGHTMFQELLHVPVIIAHTGATLMPTVECPVSILDIAPTALAFLGIGVPGYMRGENLAPLLDESVRCEARSLIAESPAYGPDSRTLIRWPKKLVERGGRRTLHDLDEDPQELRDLASAEKTIVEAMAAHLEATPPGEITGEGAPIPEEVIDQLRALGYR